MTRYDQHIYEQKYPEELTGGAGSGVAAMTLTWLGRTKTPYWGLQVKYLTPWTVPSFFPLGSESSIPTHLPGEKEVAPQNLTMPRPAGTSTIAPREGSVPAGGINACRQARTKFFRQNRASGNVNEGLPLE